MDDELREFLKSRADDKYSGTKAVLLREALSSPEKIKKIAMPDLEVDVVRYEGCHRSHYRFMVTGPRGGEGFFNVWYLPHRNLASISFSYLSWNSSRSEYDDIDMIYCWLTEE